MLRKKIESSLTLRIFCITCLMLLAASAVTYGIVALATPYTYVTILSDQLMEKSHALVADLEETTLRESGPVLDGFIRDTQAEVTIFGPDGQAVDTGSRLAARLHEDANAVAITSVEIQDVQVTKGKAAIEEGSLSSYSVTTENLTYPFSFAGEEGEYTVHISPKVTKANQTVQALGRVAPWLLLCMVIFSLFCSLFYSRWITRPIVRLSGISQKMADLDFGWTCGETRRDEIGVLGRSLDQLSNRLSAALGELRSANAALQEYIRRERQLEQQRLAFFSAVSHELKTPVTILKGQLTGMLEGVGVYEDRDKYLARSLQVTARMEGLVQEILTVSRMESSGFALQTEPLDLGRLAGDQLALDSDWMELKGLRLESDLPRGRVILGDPALLGKALGNLISNAVNYPPEGADITAALWAAGGRVVFTLQNSGVSLPQEAIPHLFEAFYRVEQSRNRSTGGSGLGLYLVKMILDRHGADYWIENTSGGVAFTMSFPAAPETLVASFPKTAQPQEAVSKRA